MHYARTPVRRLINRLEWTRIRLGIAPSQHFLLTVTGRRTGRSHTTPVSVVQRGSERWLVAPYGEVSWVHNARAAGRVRLERGRRREEFEIAEVSPSRGRLVAPGVPHDGADHAAVLRGPGQRARRRLHRRRGEASGLPTTVTGSRSWEWSRHSDLNRGPAVYETAALPLSYVGARVSIGALRSTPPERGPGSDWAVASVHACRKRAIHVTDVARLGIGRQDKGDSSDAASSPPPSLLQRRRRAADRAAAGQHHHGPCPGRRPGSVCSGIAAGGPAVRRGGPGAIASTRAGAVDGARIGAVRRARTRADGIARAALVGSTQAPSRRHRPSRAPTRRPVAAPVESASPSSTDTPVESPTPTASAGSPADTERNRVTVVAAADIDGNGELDDRVTIESPPGTILRNVHAVPIPTDPAPPAGIFFPAGLFDYEVVVAEPGDSAAVTFHLPDGTVMQGRRYRVLGPPARALVGPDRPCRRRSRHGRGHGEARRRRGRRRGPQRRRRHRRIRVVPACPGTTGASRSPLRATADPTATFNFFLEECTETTGTTPMHAPGPAPVGGLGRRGWPHAARHGDHAGDVERRAVVHVGQPRRRPPLPRHRGRDGQPARHGHRFRPGRLGGHGLRMRIRRRQPCSKSDDNSIVGFLSTIDERGRVPAPVGPTAPSATARSQKLARAAPSRPTRWATARPSARTSRSRARRWASGATSTATATSSPVAATGRPSRRASPWQPEPATSPDLAAGCLLGPGGVSARRWRPGMPSPTGVRVRAQRRTIPCRTRPSGMETPPQPSASAGPDYTNGFPIIVDGRRQRHEEHGRLRQPPDEPVDRRRHLRGPLPHRPRPRPVRIDPEQRRGRLQERRHQLRQRPRGHQHRRRDRVLRGELLARGGLHQRPRRRRRRR